VSDCLTDLTQCNDQRVAVAGDRARPTARKGAVTMPAGLIFFHLVGVVVWVGGMFFAYLCLRPAAAELLAPAPRLRLWRGVLARFFVWVAWAAALIAASGLSLLTLHGGARVPLGWHLMSASGMAMIAIYLYVVAGPFVALKRALDAEDWPAGALALKRVRQWVAVNLTLGLLTIGLATLGRLLG
jgi:uncharacterized membrane protein